MPTAISLECSAALAKLRRTLSCIVIVTNKTGALIACLALPFCFPASFLVEGMCEVDLCDCFISQWAAEQTVTLDWLHSAHWSIHCAPLFPQLLCLMSGVD